jgi:hypothetical protein
LDGFPLASLGKSASSLNNAHHLDLANERWKWNMRAWCVRFYAFLSLLQMMMIVISRPIF